MRKSTATSAIWGLIIVLLGVGFLLNSFDVLNFGSFIGTYWPLILVIIGVSELIQKKYNSALIFILLGLIFQLAALDQFDINVWAIVWPVIVIIIGINVIYRAIVRNKIQSDDKEKVTSTAAFGAIEKNITSDDFRSATLNGIFGGAKVNLKNAKISKKGAVIDAMALFGAVEIIVPKDTPVKLSTTNILGGSEDKRSSEGIDLSKPAITVQGLAMFGGIEVKSE